MPRLQVALDLLDLEKAIDIALKVADYVDLIEAGTPLIKMHGMKAVERLVDEVGKPVVADLKTMDTGRLEAEMAFKHGADYVTVLLAAHPKTIEEVIETAKRWGRGSMVDTIGIEETDIVRRKLIDRGLLPNYLLIHSGIDMQEAGITPLTLIREMGSLPRELRIGVAGGLNHENIPRLLRDSGVEIDLIIVGGGITRAADPAQAAKRIREKMEEAMENP